MDAVAVWRGVWAAFTGAGIALEVNRVRRRRGGTYSAFWQWLFRTHTPTGKALWAGGWGGFAAWFLWHVGFGVRRLP